MSPSWSRPLPMWIATPEKWSQKSILFSGGGMYTRPFRFFSHRSLALILPFNRPRENKRRESTTPPGERQKFLNIELAQC